MLVDPYEVYRKSRRVKAKPAASPVPPAGPVLVGAAFIAAETTHLRLTFDTDVMLTREDFGAAIVVNDYGLTGHRWVGDGSIVYPAANVLDFGLRDDGYVSGDGTRLTVTDASGIAGTDGVLWAGVSDLALPFAGTAGTRQTGQQRRAA